MAEQNVEIIAHSLAIEADQCYADVTFLLWRWVDAPENDEGLRKIIEWQPLNKTPVRMTLTTLVPPNKTVDAITLADVGDALRHLLNNVKFIRLPPPPTTSIRHIPPSQRSKVRTELSKAEQIIKTWRQG